MMTICKRFLKITVLIVATTLALPTWADTNRFSLLSFRPVSDDGVFSTIYESPSHRTGQWTVGGALDYANRPLIGSSAGSRVTITRYALTGYALGALGLSSRASIMASLPVGVTRFTNPDSVPFPAASNDTVLGDLQLAAKFLILNREKYPVGLSILPMITVPTGSSGTFMGDTHPTGTGLVVMDGKVRRLTWAMNMGGRVREQVDAFGLRFKDQFILSGGLAIRTNRTLTVTTEILTQTPFADFFASKTTSPMEVKAGLFWQIRHFLSLQTSAGFGRPNGSGTPNWRVTTLLRFHSKTHAPSTPSTPLPVPPMPFTSGSARLSDSAAQTLGYIGDTLLTTQAPIQIEGHTDSTGNSIRNLQLSKQRAEAAKRYLQYRAIAPERINTTGHGASHPQAPNTTPEGRAKNRRVEIH